MEEYDVELFYVVRHNDIHGVQRLLAEGHDVNGKDYSDQTPLFKATSSAMVDVLLKAGADVHWKDDHEQSVLHSVNNAEVARAFIEAGADVNYINHSSGYGCFESPLHEAVNNRGTEVVKSFLEAGAVVNARDNYGMTPLFRSRSLESAQLLIEAGADINAISKDGLTASQSIRKSGSFHGSSDLAEFIETHAIKVEKEKLQTTMPAAQPQPVKRKAKAKAFI